MLRTSENQIQRERCASRWDIRKMNTSQFELETRVKIYTRLEAINAPNVRLVVVAVTPDALL